MSASNAEYRGILGGRYVSPGTRWSQLKGQREYLPLAEGQSVGIHRGSLAGAACDIAIALARQSPFGLRLQLIRVFGDGWQDVVEHSLRVDLILICAILVGMFASVLDLGDVGHC